MILNRIVAPPHLSPPDVLFWLLQWGAGALAQPAGAPYSHDKHISSHEMMPPVTEAVQTPPLSVKGVTPAAPL